MDPSKRIFRTASVDCTKSCLATIRPSGHGQTQRELTVHLPASNLRILITREECRQLKFIVKGLWSALDHFWQWAISNWAGGANVGAFLQDAWNISLITFPFYCSIKRLCWLNCNLWPKIFDHIWQGSICSLLDGAQTTSATFMKRSYPGLADLMEVHLSETFRHDLLFVGP